MKFTPIAIFAYIFFQSSAALAFRMPVAGRDFQNRDDIRAYYAASLSVQSSSDQPSDSNPPSAPASPPKIAFRTPPNPSMNMPIVAAPASASFDDDYIIPHAPAPASAVGPIKRDEDLDIEIQVRPVEPESYLRKSGFVFQKRGTTPSDSDASSESEQLSSSSSASEDESTDEAGPRMKRSHGQGLDEGSMEMPNPEYA